MGFAIGLILFIVVSFIMYVAGAYYTSRVSKKHRRSPYTKRKKER